MTDQSEREPEGLAAAFTPSSTYGHSTRDGRTGPASPSGTFAGGRDHYHHVPSFFLPSWGREHCYVAMSFAQGLFPVPTQQVQQVLFLRDFGTFSAEMETPFPLRICLIIEFIIELSIKVQIGRQNHVKHTACAVRTV